jgi:hypothetical protein
MSNQVKEFNDYRSKMNDVILGKDNLVYGYPIFTY